MASCTSGGRAGAALSAPESSQSRAKASWLRARLWGVSSVSAASWPISSAAAGQVSPRARNGSSGSPARNCSAACPVSCKQSRWQAPAGVRVKGERLRMRCPAGAFWGGRIRALPAGLGPISSREAVQVPLETRQTQSPSPLRVRGASGWVFCTAARAAVALQSKINI